MATGNIANLVPNEARTPEERRANATKAGIASGKARREKKTLRELAIMLGQMPVTNPKMLAVMHAAGIDSKLATNDMAMMLGLQLKAQNGDSKAAKLLAELKGQYSTRVEIEPVQPKPLIDLTETAEPEAKPKRNKK